MCLLPKVLGTMASRKVKKTGADNCKVSDYGPKDWRVSYQKMAWNFLIEILGYSPEFDLSSPDVGAA